MAKDANMSYEQARTALEEIVTQLESGNLALEETLKLWEKVKSWQLCVKQF